MEDEGWCNGTKVGGLLCVCINFVFLFSVFRIGCMLAFAFFEKTEIRTVISGDVLFHITVLKNIGTAQHLPGFLPTQNLNFVGTSGLVIIV